MQLNSSVGQSNKPISSEGQHATVLCGGARLEPDHMTDYDRHTELPIHTAAEAGRVRRVRAILDADPTLLERLDRVGGTPLHRAVVGRSRSVVALLLDRGANIHARYGAHRPPFTSYPPQHSEPIDVAIWGGACTVWSPSWRVGLEHARSWLTSRRQGQHPCDLRTARLLLDRGVAYDLTIAAALGDRERVVAMLEEDPSRIRESRPNMRRALAAAAQFGHDAIARLLLERGADPTWPDADDSPRGAALHAAARAGNRPLVELLLAHGADPNGFVDSAGNAVYAAKTADIRALLVAHGGTLDPYDLVWLDEDDEVMRRVTADPASAYAGCGGVFTAVCTRGKRDLLMRLLDAGVRVPTTPDGCRSYLLEQPDMLHLLLQRGGLHPDYTDASGCTLLHALCTRDERGRTMKHRTKCAAILLDAGATISVMDKQGATPLAYATRNKLPDMVEFLRRNGTE
ncbi:MAG TPA: ankyrin repeat domain-containing protein [Gemmatimonadaceae bacterium]|nr:ankyrin repeat domain-containing protein [Gemmatimonadaceae bacterium]